MARRAARRYPADGRGEREQEQDEESVSDACGAGWDAPLLFGDIASNLWSVHAGNSTTRYRWGDDEGVRKVPLTAATPNYPRIGCTANSRSILASRARPLDPLASFSDATRDWFRASFAEPTAAQAQGWPAIAAGEHTLICAPTGSGKTLAAFLWCIDRLMAEPVPDDPRAGCASCTSRRSRRSSTTSIATCARRSRASALAARKRGEPRARGDGRHAHRRHAGRRAARVRQAPAGHPGHDARVALPAADLAGARGAARRRVGDRRRDSRPGRHQARRPPGAVAGAARVAHGTAAAAHRPVGDAAAAERRRGLPGRPRRRRRRTTARGRSAASARSSTPACARRSRSRSSCPSRTWPRSARCCRSSSSPAARRRRPTRAASIWPQIHPRILELIRAHRSTIVFVNSRRLAERLALRAQRAGRRGAGPRPPRLARARGAAPDRGDAQGRPAARAGGHVEPRAGHRHGRGRPRHPGRIAGSVARGLQRIGRAGHQVGEPSQGVIFPKYRGDLLECAVVTRAMLDGEIEPTVIPRNPLDVLAQQLVATAAGSQMAGRRPVQPRASRGELRRSGPRLVRGDAGHARRPLSRRRVRRAASARRLGSRGRDRREPARRAHRRRHQRRHDPGPRPVRRVPRRMPMSIRPPAPERRLGRHGPAAAASASSTRRWSTRRARAR